MLRNAEQQQQTSLLARMQEDMLLDPEIQASEKVSISETPDAIFLTGATGFLGGHLLSDLLRFTPAQTYSLVRAESTREAEKDLENNLKQ